MYCDIIWANDDDDGGGGGGGVGGGGGGDDDDDDDDDLLNLFILFADIDFSKTLFRNWQVLI